MIAPAPPADDRLVARFVFDNDEDAFAELVRRYEGLVMGACARILGAGGDIEDAAQSAFVSLARNAPVLAERIRPGGSLSSWIYRVAVNAALQQQRANRARCRREAAVLRRCPQPINETIQHVESRESMSILDEELSTLPATLRGPIVLCHLEGKTQRQAASELGLSYGTLRRRLDQGRTLLRTRLGRRGVTVSTGMLLLLASEPTVHAGTSNSFVADVLARSNGNVTESVACLKPRIAGNPGSGAACTTVWTCSRPVASFAISRWLIAAVLAGLLLPPVISLTMPSLWEPTAKVEPPPNQQYVPSTSPGQYAYR